MPNRYHMNTSVGRGTLYFMIVQVVFLASGYIIHAGLGRLLGPASYGVFGVVIYLVTLSQDFLRTGIPQAASKYIAEDNTKAKAIKNKTVNLQLILSLIIFSAYIMLAGIFSSLLKDPSLSTYIRISAFIIPAAAFHSLYVNFLNGLRWYDKQALVMLIYCVAKVTGVFALVLLGFALYGAILGYLIGPLAGFALGWYFFKGDKGKDKNNFEYKKIIDFAMPVIILSITITLLISADLFFVKRILMENMQAGYYTAASMLSRVPFYILSSLGFALFPAISRSTAIEDVEQTKDYITGSMRYLLMLLIPTILLISATSKSLVSFFYSSKYLPASSSLSILIFGLGFFTIFSILITIITASGRPRVSMLIALVLVPVSVVLNIILISVYRLEGAALATTITSFLGTCLTAGYVVRRFNVLIDKNSLAKICAVSIIIYLIASKISLPAILLPLLYLLLFIFYLSTLFLIKELKKEDFETFKRIIYR